MQLSAEEADGPDQAVELHHRVCLQEGYIIAHCFIIKFLMEDDGFDWIVFVSNHFGIHLSYANYSDNILPGEREQGNLEKPRHQDSFTLPGFHIYYFLP